MKNESKKTRTECDLLGCVEVPDNVLYGVQTMRGLENFAISKFRLCEYPRFIEGLAIVKLGAAIANHAMGLLSDELFGAISQACREIMAGRFHEFFPVDMIQGGVIMSMLSQRAVPTRRPEQWMADPGCGYTVQTDVQLWMRDRLVEAIDIVPFGYADTLRGQAEAEENEAFE